MNRALCSPADAVRPLAEVFLSAGGAPLELMVHEDQCFREDAWLRLGQVALFPSPLSAGPPEDHAVIAVSHGFYQFSVRPAADLVADLHRCAGLDGTTKPTPDKQQVRAAAALKMLPLVLTRLGLVHPRFDADVLAELPFSRPATIVADTSAVHGGALDFVSRFLYPAARIKVPGIVHMEVVNEVDSYLKHRRSPKLKRGEALHSRVKGLGGQRVLLRLELHSAMEIERSSIFSDPLRNAFQPDRESEATDLNVTAAVRSYADRLVLETARQQQAQVSPGHSVYLMTSDQGLARMALAEGIRPMFFSANEAEQLFSATLPGVCFHPFDGSLYSVPLAALLWEIATCFGTVRLGALGGAAVEVSAIGADLPWQPFHSNDDLIWSRSLVLSPGEQAPAPANSAKVRTASNAENSGENPSDVRRRASLVEADTEQSDRGAAEAPSAAYKFAAGGLVTIVSMLRDVHEADQAKMSSAVSVKPDQFRSYSGFLRAGGFAKAKGDALIKTDLLDKLFEAMRSRDFRTAGVLLRHVRSFDGFVRDLFARRRVSDDALRSTQFWRFPNYRRLGEACGFMLLIPGIGLCATASDPAAEEFVQPALDAYRTLVQIGGQGDGYVLTGAWLEALARDFGIHPLVARDRLQQAQASGYLQRFTRGATPDTRFEDHQFHTFEPQGAVAVLASVLLYHGDFLIPERTSVELRLEGETRR